MTWVVDATPLIVLAKAGHLDGLTAGDEAPVVPERVYEEVVETGLDEGYPDARRVKRAVDDGRFVVDGTPATDLFEELAASPSLSEADAAVLALAADREAVAVMDERAGRATADAEGIEARGTAFVVLATAKRGAISSTEVRTIVDDVVDAGWHCSTDLYARILETVAELEADGSAG